MVHVEHQHGDADEDEHIGNDDGDAGHLTAVLELDLSHRQDGVGEGGDEEPDGELARPVTEERLHDARRELAHCQLNHDHRDGEDERRQRNH